MRDNHPKVEDQIAWLKTLFGRPPVLSTEDPRAFEEIQAKIIEKLRPRDMIEQIFIWQAAVATWEMIRYMRQKTLMIPRKFRQREEALAQHRAQLLRGRMMKDDRQVDADHSAARTADENDHAQALEMGIKYYGKLDDLQQRAIFRLNSALEQLEHYRVGLGLALSQVTQEIIDVEFAEVENQPKHVAAPASEAEKESQPVAAPPTDFDETQQPPKPVAAPSIAFDELEQDAKAVGADELEQGAKAVVAPSIDSNQLEQGAHSVAPTNSSEAQQEANLDAEASCASASEQPT
jgi:hypothetical protein